MHTPKFDAESDRVYNLWRNRRGTSMLQTFGALYLVIFPSMLAAINGGWLAVGLLVIAALAAAWLVRDWRRWEHGLSRHYPMVSDVSECADRDALIRARGW